MARYELRLPEMGESVAEATITNWLKNVGDRVEEDDAVVEVATDKVDSEVPSEVSGVIKEIFFEENSVVQVGEIMAIIETDEEASSDIVDSPTEEIASSIESAISQKQSYTDPPNIPPKEEEIEEDTRVYSPLVKSIAKAEGISNKELASIEGSGTDGRITKYDMLDYLKSRKNHEVGEIKDTSAQEISSTNIPKSEEIPSSISKEITTNPIVESIESTNDTVPEEERDDDYYMRQFYSEEVRNIAKDNDVTLRELNKILGTGEYGQVTVNDVRMFLEIRELSTMKTPKEDSESNIVTQDVVPEEEVSSSDWQDTPQENIALDDILSETVENREVPKEEAQKEKSEEPISTTFNNPFLIDDEETNVNEVIEEVKSKDKEPADIENSIQNQEIEKTFSAFSSFPIETSEEVESVDTLTDSLKTIKEEVSEEQNSSSQSSYPSQDLTSHNKIEGLSSEDLPFESNEKSSPELEESVEDKLEIIEGSISQSSISPVISKVEESKIEDKQTVNNDVIARTNQEQQKSPKLKEGEELIPMSRMGKLISEHMTRSKQTSAHVQSFTEADVTRIWNWRNRVKGKFESREKQKFTFTPIFLSAVVKALQDYPMMNISVEGDNIIKKENINIGMATALPDGNLIVPVIKNADRLSLTEMAKVVNDLANRARNNQLKPDEVQNGTYTVTNIGSFGNVFGTPIINQPQVGILALGAIRKVPAVIETPMGDAIAIRYKIMLSHSYDHRVVNGALGGMFVQRVAEYLEQWDSDREV